MKLRFVLLTTVLLLSFACRDFTNPFDPSNNRPPDVPSNPTPIPGATRQDTTGLVLTWTCADPDSMAGDVPLYDVYFGAASQPPLVDSGLVTNTYEPGALVVGAVYYWKIVAEDGRGDTTAGPVWSFTTTSNLAPGLPADPMPNNGAVSRSPFLTLRWTGGDPNPDDTVRYDLYLGLGSPPPLVAAGLSAATYAPGTLDFGATYSWKVVARDRDSVCTEGPVWQFHTQHQIVFSEPGQGEKWKVGTTHEVRWNGGTDGCGLRSGPRKAFGSGAAKALPARTVKLRRPSGGLDAPDSTVFHYSTDGGTNWTRAGLVETAGRYTWQVPGPETDQARVQVRTHADGETVAGTSPVFTMYNMPPPITVTSPAAGERWRAGSSYQVTWTGGTGLVDSSVVYYSTNNGANWFRAGKAVQPGSFEWTVPGVETEEARVAVRVYVGPDLVHGTGGMFTIFSLATITVTAPNAGTRWRMASIQTVAWADSLDDPDSTVVYFRPDTGSAWERQGSATGSSYQWFVSRQASEQAQVQVRSHRLGQLETGTSDPFTVYDTAPPTQPAITSPAGGEYWEVGSIHDVTWAGGTDGMDSTVVLYSTDNGSNWTRQGMARSPGTFSWTIQGPVSSQARIGVQCWCLGVQVEAVSNQFAVTGPQYPDTVLATVAVGDRPSAICWNSVNNKAYVVNRTSGSVTVIAGASNGVVATTTVESYPAAILYDSVNNKVFVANSGSRSVSVIDGATDEVVATIEVGSAPLALAYNVVNGKLYVANNGSGANTVTVIDAAGDSVLATVVTGERPRAVAWSSTVNKVYVACFSSNEVTIIDGVTDEVLAAADVGWNPCAVVAVPDVNEVYVANSGSASNTVSIIDGNSNEVVESVQVGPAPCALAWNDLSDKVYVCNEDGNSISIILTSSHQVTNLSVRTEPVAVLWAPGVNMVYIANNGSDDITIIDGANNSTLKTLVVGDQPKALGWNGTNRKVYVANYNAGTVSVIGSSH